MEDNLFVVQMFCNGNWKRVMFEGTWIFHGLIVLLEDVDGKKTLESVNFARVLVWG